MGGAVITRQCNDYKQRWVPVGALRSKPATHLVLGLRFGGAARLGRLTEEESLVWPCRKSGTMPIREQEEGLQGQGTEFSPRVRAVVWEPQVGGFGWIRTSRTYYLYLKISLGITSNSYVLAVSEEDSSLLLDCSLSTEFGGTLSWPIAIRIFLRESPWTKKSVFSFLWKLWCSLRKQRDLDPVQEKCNLQTNSLGKSVPHPQLPGSGTGRAPPLHCCLAGGPLLFPLLFVVSGCPMGSTSFPCLSLPCSSGAKSLQVPAVPGMFFPSLSVSLSLFFYIQLQHLSLGLDFPI